MVLGIPRFPHRTSVIIACAFLLAAGGPLSVLAQDEPTPQLDEGGYKLVPAEVPDIESGKASILQGEAGAEGDRFFIQNLYMTQPVTVVLMAANPAQPLTLNLSKHRFDESDRRGDTGRDGSVAFHFRTQGELKIGVTPKNAGAGETARYFLVAWVGDDMQPKSLAPPVVLASVADGGDGGLPYGWILLLIAAVGGTVLVMRKRSAA